MSYFNTSLTPFKNGIKEKTQKNVIAIDKVIPGRQKPNLRTKSGVTTPIPKTIIKLMVSNLNIILSITVYLLVICDTTNVIVNTNASIAAKP
jgi:hypothetical protein